MKKTKVIVVVGPTASGKTALGIHIAKQFNGEVVFDGYKLKESTRVIATQMCELDYEEIEISYELDGELEIDILEGKYSYSNLPSSAKYFEDKIIGYSEVLGYDINI